MTVRLQYLVFIFMIVASCKNDKKPTTIKDIVNETIKDTLIYPEETHFKSLKQITFGGDNAEAY